MDRLGEALSRAIADQVDRRIMNHIMSTSEDYFCSFCKTVYGIEKVASCQHYDLINDIYCG